MHLGCSGPKCSKEITDASPDPDFCSFTCAAAWRSAELDVLDGGKDGGLGQVGGSDYSPGSYCRNRGTHYLQFAFDWLDKRLRAREGTP